MQPLLPESVKAGKFLFFQRLGCVIKSEPTFTVVHL